MNRILHDLHAHEFAQNLDTSINIGSVLTCNFNSSGQVLYVGTACGDVFIFDTNTKHPLARFPSVGAGVVSISSTLDQIWLLSTTTSGLITRYHIPSLSIDCQLKFPAPIRWSQMCPSNKDIVIITPIDPQPTCIINIALEREEYQHTFDYLAQYKAYELSTWLNAIPSRCNLSLLPWLIDPRFKIPPEHPLRQAYAELKHFTEIQPSILPKNVPPESAFGGGYGYLDDDSNSTPTNAEPPMKGKRRNAPAASASKVTFDAAHSESERDHAITGTRTILYPVTQSTALLNSMTKQDYITFAAFSPMGDKIAIGGNRGQCYVADIFFAPTVIRNDNQDWASIKDGYVPGMPTVVEKHIDLPREALFHDRVVTTSTSPLTGTDQTALDPLTPASFENSLAHLLNNKLITFPNGIIITNIIPFLSPKTLPRTTVGQMQFSHTIPTFTQTPIEYLVAVCFDDGHCITFNAQTGCFVASHKNMTKRISAKKAVFSPSNSHIYILHLCEEHEITIKSLETMGAATQLHGPHESCFDICAHPYLPMIVTVPATGRIIFWSTRSRESWTGYNPIFQEMEENLEYVELETDFDLNILPTHQGDVRKLYTTDYQTNTVVPFNIPPTPHPAIMMFHYAPLNHYNSIVQYGVQASKAFQLAMSEQLQQFNSLSNKQLMQSLSQQRLQLVQNDSTTASPSSLSTTLQQQQPQQSLKTLLFQLTQPTVVADPATTNQIANFNATPASLPQISFNQPPSQLQQPQPQPQPQPTTTLLPSPPPPLPPSPSISTTTILQLHTTTSTSNPMLTRPQIHPAMQFDPFLTNLVASNVVHKLANDVDIDDLRDQFLDQIQADPTTTLDQIELRTSHGFLLPPFARLYYLRKALTIEEQNSFLSTTLNEPHFDPLLLTTAQYLKDQGARPSIDHVIVKNNISSGMGAAISAELGMNNFNRIDSQTTLGRGAGPEQLSNPLYTLYHASVKRTLARHYPSVHGPGIFKDE